jgi:hypothetical protein
MTPKDLNLTVALDADALLAINQLRRELMLLRGAIEARNDAESFAADVFRLRAAGVNANSRPAEAPLGVFSGVPHLRPRS